MTMETIAARIDRLPSSRFHRGVVLSLAFIYFFEFADSNAFSYAAPALREHLGLGIGSIALVTSATFLGMFCGAVGAGRFADRVGRRRGLIVATAVFTVFSLLNALAWSTGALLAARFATGIGLAAMTVCANTYLAELMPPARRGKAQAIVSFIGHLGIPAMAFAAKLVVPLGEHGWRLVFCIGAVGALALPLVARLPESPRWLYSTGRTEQAVRALTAIERRVAASGHPLPEPVPVPSGGGAGERVTRPYRALFSPGLRRSTLVLAVVWIFTTLGYYGFLTWVPTLLADQGISVVDSLGYTTLITLGAAPGALLAWPISAWLGRRLGIALVCVLAAICGLVYGLSFNPVLVVVFGFCMAALLMAFGAQMYTYSPELFPTALRNTGNGLVYGLGRLSNVFGPMMIAAVYGFAGYQSVFVYIGLCWLISAAALVFFAPRKVSGGLTESLGEQKETVVGYRSPA
ncbi:MFS transporter [Sciscionella sediminilitoris]|uniref:MFS transporter n=1 Tax=Sciscionella sediminilitoris TaxID=1445613 RepID=UPI00055E342B|nr:MFS transporter [Sciscionella sp. SE31]